MSVNGINGNLLSSLYKYNTSESEATTSTSTNPGSILDTDTSSTDSADSIILSSQSQIYCRLQKLQQSDPDEFKKVCSNIAKNLNMAAQNAGGSGAATLAVKFSAAAESGKMSDLTASTTATTHSATSNSTSAISKSLVKYYMQLAAGHANNDDINSVITQLLDKMGIS
ncbi:MAG: hypothetical protein ABFD83_09175 [Armatimonadota bacterium]